MGNKRNEIVTSSIPTYVQTYLRAYLPTCLPTYVPTYVRTYVPTYLRSYLPACVPACLPTLSLYLSKLFKNTFGQLLIQNRSLAQNFQNFFKHLFFIAILVDCFFDDVREEAYLLSNLVS